MGIVDEKTNVPLFAILVSLPVLVATVLWVGAINSRSEASATRISENERRIEAQASLLNEIRDRLIRIEERIKKAQGE